MQRFKGREPLDFFDAVSEEKMRIAGAPRTEARRFAYVDRGFYARQLERLFKFFPREQVKVLKFEEFKDETARNTRFHFFVSRARPAAFGAAVKTEMSCHTSAQ